MPIAKKSLCMCGSALMQLHGLSASIVCCSPDDLIQRQCDLHQAQVVKRYVDSHEKANADDTLPLFLKSGCMKAFEWLPHHERQ